MVTSKLKDLGLSLPLFPTTSVGSFPKPDFLVTARAKFRRGEIDRKALEGEERKATEFWIRKQEELDIDVLADGEMYRGDMVAYVAETMGGFKEGGLVRSYGNRYYRKPVVVDEVRWKGPITVSWWQYAQGLTKRPVKGMLTGPYTIMDWSFNEFYNDRRATAMAVAREVRKEAEALISAGAKIIQIDEPALSVRPEELPIAIDAVGAVTHGLPAYFIAHVCYGDFAKIYPEMLKMPVDNFDLEMSNSELDMLQLFARHPFSKDISFGVVDVHSHKIEEKNVVLNRLREAVKHLNPQSVWVDPDCGLKTRTVGEAVKKLSVISEAVSEMRKRYL